MESKVFKGSEEAVADSPITFLRRVGHVTDTKRPCLYSQGDSQFLATICESQVQVYEIEHLRPVFSFNSPWNLEMVACQNENIFVSNGVNIAAYERAELVGTFESADVVLQILPLGSCIAVLHPHSLSVLSVPELQLIYSIKLDKSVATKMVHPKNYRNKLLIFHEDGHMSLWNVNSKAQLYCFDKYLPNDSPVCYSLTRDDDILVFGWSSGLVQLRNLKLDLVLAEFQTRSGLTDVSFRLDGPAQLVCSFSDGMASLWNIEVENDCNVVSMICENQAHSSEVIFSAFLSEKPVMLSCSMNAIKEWHLQGNEIKFVRQRMGIGKGAGHVQFYNTASDIADTVISITNEPVSLCVSNIYSDNRSIEVSKSSEDLPACEHIAVFDQRALKWDNVVSSHGKKVYTWSVEQSRLSPKSLLTFASSVACVSISFCGNYFACGLENGEIHVYNLQSQRKVVECSVADRPVFVSFDLSSKGLIVVCSSGRVFVAIDFKSRKFELAISLGIGCTMSKLFADRSLLFVACEDNAVRCVDLETRREIRVFMGHTLAITGLCASLDGRWLFTSSQDSTVRVWDMASGLEAFCLRVEDVPLTIAVSPQGDQLITSHANKLGLSLWYFEPLNIKGALLFESSSCEGISEQLREVRVSGGAGKQKWLSILHWEELRAKSVPAMPVNKSQSAPFFLSDLAYEELKRKERDVVRKAEEEAAMAEPELTCSLDYGATVEASAKFVLALNPSKVHSLFKDLGADEERHRYMLQVFIYLLERVPSGLVQFDIVVALLKVYSDMHHRNGSSGNEELVKAVSKGLDGLYRPIEGEFMNALGMISFVKGTLI